MSLESWTWERNAMSINFEVARPDAALDRLSPFPVEQLRQDFPILHTQVRGKPLVYLDNAATTQKPRAVLDALQRYYTTENANVHRGVHYLSELATELYERARGT